MFLPYHDVNPTERTPFFTVAIIAINIVVLLYMGTLQTPQDDRPLREMIYRRGFIPARLGQLTRPQPMRFQLYGQEDPQRRDEIELPAGAPGIISTAFTSMFMHAGWLHLISNMWFFWIFGNNIEDRLGHWLFLLLYLGGGIFAAGVHSMMVQGAGAQIPVVGASGAVAVTLGAYAVYYPFAKVRTLIFLIIFFTVVEIPALIVLGFWFAGQIFSVLREDVVGAQVAWWAHIGGFIAGAAAMPLLAAVTSGSRSDWRKLSEPGERLPQDYWN